MYDSLCSPVQNGNTALGIARRLGYISVVDTLRVVTEEIITTTTVGHTDLALHNAVLFNTGTKYSLRTDILQPKTS